MRRALGWSGAWMSDMPQGFGMDVNGVMDDDELGVEASERLGELELDVECVEELLRER